VDVEQQAGHVGRKLVAAASGDEQRREGLRALAGDQHGTRRVPHCVVVRARDQMPAMRRVVVRGGGRVQETARDCGVGLGGAPSIDPKRPYGNSNVYRDVAQILDVRGTEWADEELNPSLDAEWRFLRLYVETAIALQCALVSGEFRAGALCATTNGTGAAEGATMPDPAGTFALADGYVARVRNAHARAEGSSFLT
jgi:hypothetical protein